MTTIDRREGAGSSRSSGGVLTDHSRADEENNSTDDEKLDEIYLIGTSSGAMTVGIQRLYQEVQEGLEKKSTLTYENSVTSLTNALHTLTTPETICFLDKCLYKMVSILLDQNPSKIGGFERGKIEDSLDLSIRILVVIMNQNEKYLDVLVKIFSRTPTYYAGSKTAWTNYPGDPHVRLCCVAKFHDLLGFDIIRKIMETQWLGAEKLQVLLSALRDVDPSLSNPLSESIVQLVVTQLLDLSDEVLKKENTDSLSSIMSSAGLLPKKDAPEAKIKAFYQFWLDMTLKMMNCNSIVIKLFAWEQIQAIIKESRHTRPPANRYLVRNAGTEEVNGIYERNFKKGDVPLYVKKPAKDGDKLFTLFRCTMRSKQKWWFISIADVEKPGTDKDIDYYQHKSTPEQDMEPPVLGWVVVTGANAHAVEPAPVLIRLETITDDNGEPITSLMDLLIEWSSQNNLLERVFGYHSIHREIVSRSTSLLTLLCDEDKLSEGDIQAIWKVGITNPSEETYSEVLTLLANSALHMSDTALDILVDLVLNTVDPTTPTAPQILHDHTLKVAEFLDKIHYEGIKYIRCLTDHAKDRVVELVWKLYANPAIENYKNHNHIEDLLSICLRYHRNKDSLLINYLEECSAALSLLPSSCPDTIDEKKMSRLIHVLEFLLNLCGVHHDPLIEEFFMSTQFHAVLFNELKRYVQTHCASGNVRQLSSLSTTGICHGVNKRLFLLRIAYGISSSIKLSIDRLKELWSLFFGEVEISIQIKEEFFNFLRLAGVKEERRTYDSAYHIAECYVIFETMLCNPMVDWSLLSEDSFACFQTYFNGLVKKNDTDKIHAMRVLGLKTLWKIILYIPSETCAKDAITLLLSTYQEMLFYDLLIYEKLLDEIFDHLRKILEKMNSEPLLSFITQREISRCSDLLNRVLAQSQTLSVSSELPHGMRGTISRINVTIKYREVVPSTTHFITVYNKRTPQMEKSPEKTAVLDISPHHTIAILKDKIRALAVHHLNGALPFGSSNQKRGVTIEFGNSFLNGDQRLLSDFGVVDGSTLIATILQSQSVSAYDVDDYQDPYYTNTQNQTIAPSRSGDSHPLALKKLYGYLTARDNFECLMNLVQLLEDKQLSDIGIEFAETSKKVWELMMSLPPQQEIYDSVRSDFDSAILLVPELEESKFENEIPVVFPKDMRDMWSLLTPDVNTVRATYVLQILDYFLQPAPEVAPDEESNISRIREGFLISGGFVAVFNYFISSSSKKSPVSNLSQAVALHIIHYCLHDPITHEVNTFLINQIQELSSHSSLLIEKFLLVAYNSAQVEETNILQRALETITSLLQISSLATQLTENRYSKSLLTSVLKNPSKIVRSMASNFAVEINRSQPVVIEWLIDEFERMQYNDEYCYDILQIIILLLQQMAISTDFTGVDRVISHLISLIASKMSHLRQYTTNTNPLSEFSRQTLLGCLELITEMVKINCKVVIATEFGRNLVSLLMNDYLFAVPEDSNDRLPLCDVGDTRKAAFMVLKTCVQHWPHSEDGPLGGIIARLESLNQWATTNIKHSWSIQTSYDLKKANIPHLGLKNQGCTCYLNSLVQQLYMNTVFREIVMNVRIHKDYRSTLWHYSEEELIGRVFLFEWTGNNLWKRGTVVEYDPVTHHHSISYETAAFSEVVTFNIHTGRPQKETGRIRVIKDNDDISEREFAAIHVLEQLQRLFCYLEKSKKRYFDPKMFIESCKTLNLNFNIYHQNDATEFYDQLLDRLETAMKGAYCTSSTWDKMKSRVFGGQMLAQKIPKECSAYEENKANCGHWQSTRKEGFLKTELLIRNKEKIEDSLSQLVEGELMDGDNKIMCDVCVQKKDTIRRTCFGTLPNLLVVHLKRFDLDFNTFETVKLNNKMSFPTTLDMFPYTKEGIEYYELLAETTPSSPEGGHPARSVSKVNDEELEASASLTEGLVKPDSIDYEYELQGVLVHSGIAQGGHYYSFIRESQDPNKWYLFDDDDVTHFNPENIPVQCFGGSYQTSYHGVTSMIEEDRSSNALMLFYNKVKSFDKNEDDGENSSESKNAHNTEDFLDGYQAFDREVHESNRRHVYINYLVDSHLHTFVRDLLKLASPNSASVDDGIEMDTDHELPPTPALTASLSTQRLDIVKFTTNFFLHIVLHCRERTSTKVWIQAFKDIFEHQSSASIWLLRYLIGKNAAVLREFLFHSGDAMARGTFVQLVIAALMSLCSNDPELRADEQCLEPYLSCKPAEIIQMVTRNSTDHKSLIAAVVFSLLKIIADIPTYLRSSDEVFHLLRDMAINLPPVRTYLIQKDVLASICFFVSPETSPQHIKEQYSTTVKFTPVDVKPLYPVIFEAIAGLLNVPQKQRVPLLIERTNIWDPELTPEAKEALTIIFKENSHYGGMDSRDIINYMDRVHESDETVPKVTALQVRSILDRYDTTTDGRLALSGFLRYYADTALYQPKSVWKDLKAFGFQNDLTRVTSMLSDTNDAPQYPPLILPPSSRQALLSTHLLEIGLESAEIVTGAIIKRICWKEPEISRTLCKMVLRRLKSILGEWTWNPAENLYLGLLRVFGRLEDGLLDLRLEELIGGPEGLLTVIVHERTHPPRQVVNAYSHVSTYETRPLSHRYLDLLHELSLLPAVANWIQLQASTSPDQNYQWLASQLNRSHLSTTVAPVKTRAEILTSALQNTTIVVNGGGAWEVDGTYTFLKVLNGAGVFRKTTKYDDELVEVLIYRCRMQNNTWRWFMSIAPDDRDPGTESDTDFYWSVGNNEGDGLPPTIRWTAIDHKFSPVPSVMINTIDRVHGVGVGGYDGRSDEEDQSSDHEDSMAVIDDEFPYIHSTSPPGTPIDIPPSP